MVRHKSTDASDQDHRLLGQALRELRENAGLTQAEMGARADIGATYLSQLENGHRGVGWHTVMRILRGLDADLRDLGGAIDRQKRTSKP
ncbi:MAG TPA: helix-turn-helix transcriptional regulator [Solirubrobacteraceae bacterium]|jgi:transcriptional regulator with XRE-family HTH domain|nr:helix-turn-helix transcriptional regulator [Solirubrobacteraceae bacterium]